jgi:hypothetical protein
MFQRCYEWTDTLGLPPRAKLLGDSPLPPNPGLVFLSRFDSRMACNIISSNGFDNEDVLMKGLLSNGELYEFLVLVGLEEVVHEICVE